MCQRPGRAWKFLRWLHGSRLLLWAFLLWLFLSFRRDANKGGITHGRGYNVRGWVILGLDWDFVWNTGLGTLKLGWALAWGRGTGTGTGTACCFSGCQNKVKNQMFLISTLTASWQRSINFDNIFFLLHSLAPRARRNWKACVEVMKSQSADRDTLPLRTHSRHPDMGHKKANELGARNLLTGVVWLPEKPKYVGLCCLSLLVFMGSQERVIA